MLISRRLLVFLCLIPLCFAQRTPRKCADVPIVTSDGKTIKIPQYAGKVVMIEIMLTDCPPCLETLQFMAKLQKDYAARGFQAVAIALDPDGAVVKPFAERYRFPFPVGHLDKDPAIKFLDLNQTAHPVVPYIMFVDWQGSVRFQYPADAPIFNSAEKNFAQIADGLLRQAAEKKGPQYETRPAGKQ
jgi:thiol-disulfide isomerase/thioredoxin